MLRLGAQQFSRAVRAARRVARVNNECSFFTDRLRLVAFDGDASLEASDGASRVVFPLDGDGDLEEMYLIGKELGSALLQPRKEEMVELSVVNGKSAVITRGRDSVHVQREGLVMGEPFFDLPPDASMQEVGKWSGESFLEALRYVLPACLPPSEHLRRNIYGIEVTRKRLLTTDGHRAHFAALSGWCRGAGRLPTTAAWFMKDTLSKDDEVLLFESEDRWAWHYGDKEVWVNRNYQPDYQDMRQAQATPDLVDKHVRIEVMVPVVLDILQELQKAKAEIVQLTSRRESLRFVGKLEDHTEVARVKVKAERRAPSGTFRILLNLKYLLEAFSIPGGKLATLTFGEENISPVGVSSPGFGAVIMPLRP